MHDSRPPKPTNAALHRRAFSHKWHSVASPTCVPTVPTHIVLKPWQEDGRVSARGKKYWLINAPTGSGKTIAAEAIIADWLYQYPTGKAIICTPQTQIGENFRFDPLPLPDGQPIWQPNNLCNITGNIGSKFLEFLLDPDASSINSRTIICTYATLLSQRKELESYPEPLLVWVDEAHHIQGADEEEEANLMGSLVSRLMQNEKNAIGLSTATFFRGDRTPILTEGELSRFHRIDLTYEKYLASLTYLTGCSYDFITYHDSPQHSLNELLASPQKTIIYLPYVNSRHNWVKNKGGQLQMILNALGNYTEGASGEYILEDGRVVVELITQHKLRQKKTYLGNGKVNKVDVIIALGMFKEGSNWPAAERVIIVGARGSCVEMLQIIGRLMRDWPGKSKAEIIQLIRWNSKDNPAVAQGYFNDYLKGIYTSLLLEEVILPKCRFLQNSGVTKATKIIEHVVTTGMRHYLTGTLTNEVFSNIVAEVDPDNHWETEREIKRLLAGRMHLIDPATIDLNLVEPGVIFKHIALFFGKEINSTTLGMLKAVLAKKGSPMDTINPDLAAEMLRERSVLTEEQYLSFARKTPGVPIDRHVFAKMGWDCWKVVIRLSYSPYWGVNFLNYFTEAGDKTHPWWKLQFEALATGELGPLQAEWVHEIARLHTEGFFNSKPSSGPPYDWGFSKLPSLTQLFPNHTGLMLHLQPYMFKEMYLLNLQPGLPNLNTFTDEARAHWKRVTGCKHVNLDMWKPKLSLWVLWLSMISHPREIS